MFRVHGFYGHVRLNDLRSLAMFAGFAVAVQIVAAVALFAPLVFLDIRRLPFFSFGYVERYVPVVFAVGLALFAYRYLRHVATVRASLNVGLVDRRTEPRLVNVVETMAIAAGLPLPKVGVIESPALNAFACGLTASSAVVVVTRGLLDELDDRELAAVVAHEVAHIRNGDIRLLAAANVLMELLLVVHRKNPLGRVGWKRALLVLFMPALLLLFGAARFATRIAFTIARASRLLISSSREFVADAEAVRLTHDPAALVSALRRIEGRSAVTGLSPQADAMMIDGAVEGPFASHPSIAERIAVLARLSGGLVSADAPEVRTAARAVSSTSPWELAAVEPTSATPARFMVQRVNVGVKKSTFGLTTGARWVLGIGFTIMVAGVVTTFMSVGKTVARTETKMRAKVAETTRPMQDASGVIGAASDRPGGAPRPRTEAQRLSALDPLETRCFGTNRYTVGDRGLKRLQPPDPDLVQSYLQSDGAGSSEVALERYLAMRERSLRAIAGADGAELHQRLLSYVGTRKSALWVVHRFYDDAGLRLVQDAYDSPADQAVLATLGEKLKDGGVRGADPRLAGEMALLVAAPRDFVPCLARAEANERVAKAAHAGAP